jgi:lysophospholipase L1-like esterase
MLRLADMIFVATLMIASTVAQQCRVLTDPVAQTPYRWRNAYTPSHQVADTPESFKTPHFGTVVSKLPGVETHEYAFCNGGKGPYAYNASGVSVMECAAQCLKINCTCFDFACDYHEADNCTCPTVPKITPDQDATKVACVGDSITAGYLSSCGLTYPARLQVLLGSKYHVTNYGVGGVTMLRHGDAPYWNTKAYTNAVASKSDIVIIMLGTNDAKRNNWGNATLASEYPSDYAAMIANFRAANPAAKIWNMVPLPLYKDGVYNMNQTVINTVLPPLVKKVRE